MSDISSEEVEKQMEELELKKKQIYIEEENEKIRIKQLSSSISDNALWFLIIIISAMTCFDIKLYNIHFLIYFFVNGIFIAWDSNELKKHYIVSPSLGWIIIVPVYIWKRNRILYKSQYTFWIYIFLPIIVLTLIGI